MNLELSLVLNAWLQRADKHYLDGVFLRNEKQFYGGGVLLALALEQIMKLLLLQNNALLLGNNLDLNNLYLLVDKEARKINQHHNLNDIFKSICNEYNITDTDNEYQSIIEKMEFLFNFRYYQNKSFAINPWIIEKYNVLYFSLRLLVNKQVLAYLDTIYEEELFKHHKNPKFINRNHKHFPTE